MAEQACTTYGYQPSAELHKIFTDYTRTHNQAVFDAYTPEMKKARQNKKHLITSAFEHHAITVSYTHLRQRNAGTAFQPAACIR